jgi:hypothetical protein
MLWKEGEFVWQVNIICDWKLCSVTWNTKLSHLNVLISSSALTYCTYLLHGLESYLRTNCFSASQKIPRILWNPKVHYRIHKCPPPVPILIQPNPVHTTTFDFLKIDLNIRTILPSTPWSPNWYLSLRLCVSPLPHLHYVPRPSHFYRFYHSNNIGWGVQIIKLLINSSVVERSKLPYLANGMEQIRVLLGTLTVRQLARNSSACI